MFISGRYIISYCSVILYLVMFIFVSKPYCFFVIYFENREHWPVFSLYFCTQLKVICELLCFYINFIIFISLKIIFSFLAITSVSQLSHTFPIWDSYYEVSLLCFWKQNFIDASRLTENYTQKRILMFN